MHIVLEYITCIFQYKQWCITISIILMLNCTVLKGWAAKSEVCQVNVYLSK